VSPEPVEELRAVAGDALRSVARYDRDEVELLYERDDVARKPRVIDRIRDELVMQELGREYLEDLFGVGRWNCTMHRFDDAVCVHFADGDFTGTFVSVDADADVDLLAVGDACNRPAD
jgi:hypothetical protein